MFGHCMLKMIKRYIQVMLAQLKTGGACLVLFGLVWFSLALFGLGWFGWVRLGLIGLLSFCGLDYCLKRTSDFREIDGWWQF